MSHLKTSYGGSGSGSVSGSGSDTKIFNKQNI